MHQPRHPPAAFAPAAQLSVEVTYREVAQKYPGVPPWSEVSDSRRKKLKDDFLQALKAQWNAAAEVLEADEADKTARRTLARLGKLTGAAPAVDPAEVETAETDLALEPGDGANPDLRTVTRLRELGKGVVEACAFENAFRPMAFGYVAQESRKWNAVTEAHRPRVDALQVAATAARRFASARSRGAFPDLDPFDPAHAQALTNEFVAPSLDMVAFLPAAKVAVARVTRDKKNPRSGDPDADEVVDDLLAQFVRRRHGPTPEQVAKGETYRHLLPDSDPAGETVRVLATFARNIDKALRDDKKQMNRRRAETNKARDRGDVERGADEPVGDWNERLDAVLNGGTLADDPLTDAERELIALRAIGNTNQQIADRLGISYEAAARRWSRVLEKLRRNLAPHEGAGRPSATPTGDAPAAPPSPVELLFAQIEKYRPDSLNEARRMFEVGYTPEAIRLALGLKAPAPRAKEPRAAEETPAETPHVVEVPKPAPH